MKFTKLSLLLTILILTSCSSLRVTSDYDTEVDFDKYKTFAFYKKGIDKADISDLDKKRILIAIENQSISKGLRKSKDPDILVSIFTKSRERVNVNNTANWGFGWSWRWGGLNPWMYGNLNNVNINQYTEGTLFIDILDTESNSLVWQGIGSGAMRMKNVEKKKERIKEFVRGILDKYPPLKE